MCVSVSSFGRGLWGTAPHRALLISSDVSSRTVYLRIVVASFESRLEWRLKCECVACHFGGRSVFEFERGGLYPLCWRSRSGVVQACINERSGCVVSHPQQQQQQQPCWPLAVLMS